MSQLESHHFFREDDHVEHVDGRQGRVVESYSLFAVIEWEWGPREEVEQFTAEITVVERGG